MRDKNLRPFLKWAGGKRWLAESYPHIFPTTFVRYHEPFLGSGATFFYLKPEKAVLSDLNSDLIATFEGIRDNWEKVQKALRRHHSNHSEIYYYEERRRVRRNISERAAQFVYLNRTCWNGLYRVNLNGKFNVPKGTKTNVILPTDDFETVSGLLDGASLLSGDFEKVIDKTECGDFLFVDPPYTVKHNINGFVKYNENLFTWEDQVRLSGAIIRAARRGVQILATNANHQAVRDLYSGVGKLEKLERHSMISGDKISRGETTELAIIINYNPGEA